MRIDSADAFARLLADPATPRETLLSVCADVRVWREVLACCPHAAAWVAANRALPREIVEQLAASDNVVARAALACAPTLPEGWMLAFAHDPSELIRVRLVCNAMLTREVLILLAADACKVVAARAQARLAHDASGVALPDDYLDEIGARDVLH